MTDLDDDVLERRLRETFRVVAEAPISPGQTPVVHELHRPRIRRQVSVALVTAAIVVVFFVPLPHVSLFHSLVAPAKVGTPTNPPTKLPVVDLSATPAGWVPVAYGDAQVSVPSDWKVEYEQACWLWHAPGTVEVGPGGNGYCPAYGNGNKAVPVVALGPRPALVKVTNGPRESVNELTLVRYFHNLAETSYFVPSLDVTLTLMGEGAQRVVHTLTRSPRSVALASGPARAVPSSWQTVMFQGLSFAVPSSWPVTRTSVNHGLGYPCAMPGVALSEPGVVLSTDEKPYGYDCVATVPPGPQTPQDGIQVDAGAQTLSQWNLHVAFSTHCLPLHALTACPATSLAYSILVLRVTVPGRKNPVYVSIGLAGNGMIARTILYSLKEA
jgi:hypothetical protein